MVFYLIGSSAGHQPRQIGKASLLQIRKNVKVVTIHESSGMTHKMNDFFHSFYNPHVGRQRLADGLCEENCFFLKKICSFLYAKFKLCVILTKNFLSSFFKVILGQNIRKGSEYGKLKLNGLHRDASLSNIQHRQRHFSESIKADLNVNV